MLAAVSAGMSFGRGPWMLEHPEYEAVALKAARWHDRFSHARARIPVFIGGKGVQVGKSARRSRRRLMSKCFR